MLKQLTLAMIIGLALCSATTALAADNTNGNNGWGNGGGDGTTPGSDNGNGFGMTIDDHGNTSFHGVEGGTKSSPAYGR